MKRNFLLCALLLIPVIFSCWQVDVSKINSYLVEHKVAYDYGGRHYEETINLQAIFSPTHWTNYAYLPGTFINIPTSSFLGCTFNVILKSNGDDLRIFPGGDFYDVVKINVGKLSRDYVVEGDIVDGLYVIDAILKSKSEHKVNIVCSPNKTDETSFSIWPCDSSANV